MYGKYHFSSVYQTLIDVLKKSAAMMLSNEIEHYMQQWNYIKN